MVTDTYNDIMYLSGLLKEEWEKAEPFCLPPAELLFLLLLVKCWVLGGLWSVEGAGTVVGRGPCVARSHGIALGTTSGVTDVQGATQVGLGSPLGDITQLVSFQEQDSNNVEGRLDASLQEDLWDVFPHHA